MRRSLIVGTLAIALVGTACSSNSRTVTPPSAPSRTNAPTNASTTVPAPSCAPAAAYGPGTSTHTMQVAGVARAFLVHIPPHLAAHPMLVVDFHGAQSDMQEQAVYSGFDAIADAHGFVVATPNGTIISGVRQWNFLGTVDADFAVDIVHELVAHACVDPHRVFATGISSGGAMTANLACRASNTFSGFAPVSADFYIPAICSHAQARPFVIFHGTADPIVPYGGGAVSTRNGVGVQGAEATAAKWAAHNGCAPARTDTELSSQVVRLSWTHCTAPVVMYRIVGGGHTWPGATVTVPLGLTTHQINASQQMYDLFASSAA
jgi:polyhydroxybutyrate depolymerase